ncbi:MAG TPA: nickel pincer cofactor biosynthesis protein LarC [Rectinemataceae bacterium]|nr:nickel pincer cofactor biosynthesis protein LarC [Rectinemataceae bacterium]
MVKTETILYFDCFSGICGDMTIAALVDLGVPEEHLRSELGKLGLGGWRLRFKRDSKHGIGGTRADVDLLPTPVAGGLLAAGAGRKNHEHRAYREIKAMIQGSELGAGAKARALAIFAKLAAAEATVHGTEVEDVGFHEVGAVDSIIDIVGAAVCLDYLKPDRVLCSSVELGGGFVTCQHGVIPVPAPAVVELLKGAPVKSGAVQKETTTPTGAAVLAASVDEYSDDKRFRITRAAYGIGHRDTEIPNVLRVMLGERDVAGGAAAGGAAGDAAAGAVLGLGAAADGKAAPGGVLVECNIDDMSPECHGHVLERLFAAGADDAWLTPIVMKKNRAAVALSAIAPLDREDALVEAMLRETSTFGLRRSYFAKTSLERDLRTLRTSMGEVRVKTAYLRGEAIKSKFEYEDIRRIAGERGLSIAQTIEAVREETR